MTSLRLEMKWVLWSGIAVAMLWASAASPAWAQAGTPLLQDSNFGSWSFDSQPFASAGTVGSPDSYREIQHRHGGIYPNCGISQHWTTISVSPSTIGGRRLRFTYRVRASYQGAGLTIPAATINPFLRQDGGFAVSFNGPSIAIAQNSPGPWVPFQSGAESFVIDPNGGPVELGVEVGTCGFGAASPNQALVRVHLDDFFVEAVANEPPGPAVQFLTGTCGNCFVYESQSGWVSLSFRDFDPHQLVGVVLTQTASHPVSFRHPASNTGARLTIPAGSLSLSFNAMLGTVSTRVQMASFHLTEILGARLGVPGIKVLLTGGDGSPRCFLDTAMQMGSLLRAGGYAPLGSGGVPTAKGAIESGADDGGLDTLRGLRDRVLSNTETGRHYAAMYRELTPELLGALSRKPALLFDLFTVRNAWIGAVEALVEGRGEAVFVTPAMAVELNAFLDSMASAASPVLRKTIATERARLGLDAITGLSMSELRAKTLGRTAFERVGATAYFVASTPESGRELWRTDGTTQGTALHFDACPGACDGDPDLAPQQDGRLLFFARREAFGPQTLFLLQSSGASALAERAFDHGEGSARRSVAPGTATTHFLSRDPDGDELVDLWRSNGTVAGTARWSAQALRARDPLLALGTRLFFAGSDTGVAALSATGSNGTAAALRVGPELLLERPQHLAAAGARLVAAGLDATGVHRVVSTDGTDAASRRLTAIHGAPGLEWARLAPLGTRVVVAARRATPDAKPALWVTDGTVAKTSLLRQFADAEAFDSGLVLGASDDGAAASGANPNHLAFVAFEKATGHEAWVTDGTSRGTKRALDVCAGTCSSDAAVIGPWGARSLVRATDSKGVLRIYALEASGASTVLGAVCTTKCSGASIRVLADDDRRWFLVAKAGSKVELWESRGQKNDLRKTRTLPLDTLPSAASTFLPTSDRWIFGAPVGAGSDELAPFAISFADGKIVRLTTARP